MLRFFFVVKLDSFEESKKRLVLLSVLFAFVPKNIGNLDIHHKMYFNIIHVKLALKRFVYFKNDVMSFHILS